MKLIDIQEHVDEHYDGNRAKFGREFGLNRPSQQLATHIARGSALVLAPSGLSLVTSSEIETLEKLGLLCGRR